MIYNDPLDIQTLLTIISTYLSPQKKFKRTQRLDEWEFSGSSWSAVAVREEGHIEGLRLISDEFKDEAAAAVEYAIAILNDLHSCINDFIELKSSYWNKSDLGYGEFDFGYESVYRYRTDTVRVTIHHERREVRGTLVSTHTARAEVMSKGKVRWNPLCELRGDQIKSGLLVNFFDERDIDNFEADEAALHELSLAILGG